MTKNVLFRIAAVSGLLFAQGMLQSCDRESASITSSATPGRVALAPRFAGSASVPKVGWVKLTLTIGKSYTQKTVPYRKDSLIDIGSVKPGDAFAIGLLGYDPDGEGGSIWRWWATGKGVAQNSSSLQYVDIAVARLPDTAALAALPVAATAVDSLRPSLAASGQTIWYTTDGSDPRIKNRGTLLSSAVAWRPGTWMIALKQADDTISDLPELWSGVKTIVVTAPKPEVKAPIFSTTAMWLFVGDSVVITGTAGNAFYYTTDGTSPSASSLPYTGAVHFAGDTLRLKAIAMDAGNSSPVVADTFYRARRDTSTYGIPWNTAAEIIYDSLLDARDGHVYRTVEIGTQTWMAENLDFRNWTGAKDSVGNCYLNNASNCDKYGRLYSWDAARSACPAGWHLPSKPEWDALITAAGGATAAGLALKSAGGWNTWNGSYQWSGDGHDSLGMRLLPSGAGAQGTSGISWAGTLGSYAYFWTATEGTSSAKATNVRFFNESTSVTFQADAPIGGLHSVRCVKD